MRKDGKLKKDTSVGHYVDAVKGFLNWAVKDGRIQSNPLSKVEKPARDEEEKGVLDPEQFLNLIKTTIENNTKLRRTTGHDRALLYLLAGMTGLRKNELLQLRWEDLHLDAEQPFVRAKADTTKNGEIAKQPIPPAVSNVLRALKGRIKADLSGRLFHRFAKYIDTALLIKSDLKAAKIPLIDRDGNRILFHSLRNSYISWLANSDTPPKVVQQLARHSDFKMTFDLYARTFKKSEHAAIAALPQITESQFDPPHCDRHCDQKLVKHGQIRTGSEEKNRVNDSETAFSGQKENGEGGIRPLIIF